MPAYLPSRLIRLAIGLNLWLALFPAVADWAGFARYGALAEISIEGRAIHVNLRALDRSLPRFAQLAAPEGIPPEWEALASRLLVIKDRAGHPLAAQATPTPAQPLDPQAEPFHEADFTYSLPDTADTLSLAPLAGLSDPDIGLIVLDRGVPLSDLGPLDRPLSLRLDRNPWRSHFDDPARIRRHAEPRSYLYVEPYEVRHELLLRLSDLLPALGLAPGAVITPNDRPALKQKIGAYLAGRNPLLIDGAAIPPQVDRVEFVRFSRLGVQPVDEALPLDANSALAGVMLAYLTEKPAERLALTWDLFGPELPKRPVSVIQGRESFDGELSQKQPVFEWSREDALEPNAAAEAEPAAPVAGESTAETLAALLHNAYRAFALRSEEAAYDRLAKSLDGDLLEDIYLQQRQSLLRQAEGLGGEGRVDRIEILESKVVEDTQSAEGYAVDARWIAHGSVSHWGHSHPRHNLYAARLVLRRSEAGWKITAMDFQGGQRLDAGAGT
jgi:hypothetical protein